MTESVVVAFHVTDDIARLVWTATPGQTFTVQYKNNLDDPQWYELPDQIIADDTTATLEDHLDGENQRFYRIVWQP
jgi:hypothetical protein